MRHTDPKLTTRVYTNAGMLPIWDAVGGLPMFNDTQIDTQEIVQSGRHVSRPVAMLKNNAEALDHPAETFNPSETSIVPQSPNLGESAPCRNRTCNPLIKSQLLCQLS
jgi:hypothetical protein